MTQVTDWLHILACFLLQTEIEIAIVVDISTANHQTTRRSLCPSMSKIQRPQPPIVVLLSKRWWSLICRCKKCKSYYLACPVGEV